MCEIQWRADFETNIKTIDLDAKTKTKTVAKTTIKITFSKTKTTFAKTKPRPRPQSPSTTTLTLVWTPCRVWFLRVCPIPCGRYTRNTAPELQRYFSFRISLSFTQLWSKQNSVYCGKWSDRLMLNVADSCPRHGGEPVQVFRYGSFAGRIPAWRLSWSKCWTSPRNHSYVQSL